MLKVEFIKKKETFEGTERTATYAVINGIENDNAVNGGNYRDNGTFNNTSLYIENDEILNVIYQYSMQELSKYFNVVMIPLYIENWEYWIDVAVQLTEYFDDKKPVLSVKVEISYADWANSYTITEFERSFKDYIDENPKLDYTFIEEYGAYFGVKLPLVSLDENLGAEISQLEKKISELITNVKIKALELVNPESVVLYFRFPEQVKTASKQYLIYFTQFLEDLGIKANADISEEIGQTLFKVTPVDKEEALDKIKDALSIYLNAPADSSFNDSIKIDDIAVMQWQANILHLKSQLTLAASILETKQATIDTLKLTNYQLTEIIKKHDETKQEPIIKDLVSVKKYEGKALVINWPEIVRRLKRKLK